MRLRALGVAVASMVAVLAAGPAAFAGSHDGAPSSTPKWKCSRLAKSEGAPIHSARGQERVV